MHVDNNSVTNSQLRDLKKGRECHNGAMARGKPIIDMQVGFGYKEETHRLLSNVIISQNPHITGQW